MVSRFTVDLRLAQFIKLCSLCGIAMVRLLDTVETQN